MSIQGNEANRQVRFGATIAAVGTALRANGAAFLLAWAAHAVLSSISPVLTANHVVVPNLPFGPPGWSTNLPISAAIVVVSGLLVRWMLNPNPAALRPDARLAGYVGLILLSQILITLLGAAALPGTRNVGDLALRAAAVGLGSLVISLVYALLALWPVSVLTGDRLSPAAAIERMRQPYLAFLGLSFLLLVPPIVLVDMRLFAGHGVRDLTSRLLSAGVTALTSTIATVVLAQIYARRVQGRDLGSEPLETVGDVFA